MIFVLEIFGCVAVMAVFLMLLFYFIVDPKEDSIHDVYDEED